jgi:predicted nucleic acid-binding protein
MDVTKIFLDTNILVYANDRRDREKQETATKVLTACIRERRGVISTQVLQEYASVAIYKLHQDTETVIRRILQFESMEVVQLTPALIRRALELHARYGVHDWDASILAAAEAARCDRLWSEDFKPGVVLGTMRVENPLG